MTALPRIAMPARLSDAEGADARVGLANAIFDDVAALVRAEELDVVVVRSVDLAGFDGVVLPGGGDLDPARYGGDTAASVYDVNAEQDDLDLGIARAAAEAGIPILGVCRGLQVLNVAFGGTLVEDLPESAVRHSPGDDGCGDLEWAWHPVAVAAGSRLRAEVDADTVPVASGPIRPSAPSGQASWRPPSPKTGWWRPSSTRACRSSRCSGTPRRRGRPRH